MLMTTDTIILASAVLTALLVIALIASLWRGRTLQKRLVRANTILRQKEELLTTARIDFRGHSVALEQAQTQLQDKRAEIAAMKTDLATLQKRCNAALQYSAELRTRGKERETQHEEQIQLLSDTRDSLKKEFENLANKIFEDKGQAFSHHSRTSLEALLKPFREQISGFQSRINEVHSESLKGNTALEAEIKKVLDIGLEMNSQASNLATALKGDKKATGNWGEVQLERALELSGLQINEHYQTQSAFRDDDGKRKLPDFIIKLPDGKNLVIDSKVSLVDYDRAISADSEESRQQALLAHGGAVRKHIDDLASKDYANLPGLESPNFVLMFMPIEPAYIEAMKNNRGLFDYGYQKGVVMVSNTTLMPILRTVANLWMVHQSNKEAREISLRAGDIYNQVCRVADRLDKLGNSMRTAQGHYNDAITSLVGKQGLHSKVERFQQLSGKANKEMPTLEPLIDDMEINRLTTLANETKHDSADTSSQEEANVQTLHADRDT